MLVFTCTTTQTWKDGTTLKTNARIEITPKTLGYVEYHDYGGKLELVGQGMLEKLEPSKVTFSDDAVKLSYIDRTTGEEYWKDQLGAGRGARPLQGDGLEALRGRDVWM